MSGISKSDSTNCTLYRSTVKASLTHLASLEQQARILRDRPSVPRIPKTSPRSLSASSSVCTSCGTPGCHFTECPQGQYVFDSPSVARPLAPGEVLSAPASWRDLHRATLQGILRVFGHYYGRLHNSPRHLENARLIITTSLGLPAHPPQDPLLATAILAVVTRLRADPATATIPGIVSSLCECYHTPVFGISLSAFAKRVATQLACPSPP